MTRSRLDKIIDGKAFAAGLRARVAERTAKLKAAHGLTPGIAVVLVGEDPASQVYVRNKGRAVAEAGMVAFDHRLAADASESELLALVAKLNGDARVNGILVQLPLPDRIDSARVIDAIDPAKDVDGFHVVNAGLLATGGAGLVPCTPMGCLMMLKDRLGDLSGQKALVIGRSNIVGKPMAALLLREHCTVTMAHSRTRDLAAECRRADILIAAVGRPGMVRGDWIKPGAVVIDVGMNRIPAPTAEKPEGTRLVGDVAFDEAVEVAGAITPVPGGVGPMTIACLLVNTLAATCRQHGVAEPEG
ncbi:MAG: bifunctional methylenetetrahydrofolate dehydrogenase/methenyltetrahydrofolate cyclohydrolase FolD [Alphaproteobacteria bacterium]